MSVKTRVRPGEYHDSVTLMLVARELAKLPGVLDAAVVMATEANKAILQEAGLLTAEAEPQQKRQGRRRAGSAAVERPAADVSANVPRRPLTDEECRHWGYQLLAGQLSAAQQQSSVKWMVEQEGGSYGLVQGRSFPDLVVAMYLQLGEMMRRGERYRTCQGCGGPFWFRGGKQKFCDTRCGDAYRQRRFYRHPQTEAASSRRTRTTPIP